MGKLYTKNTWVDEVLTEAALHEVTDPAGDPIPGGVTDITTAIAALNSLLAILETGAKISLLTDVAVAGTALTAARMNNIEGGIDALDDLLVALQSKFTFDAATELTIAGGAITTTQTVHKLQPETSTSDDLDTINGLSAGDILILYVSDAGTDTITIKHGTGNISCLGATDVALSQGSAIFYSDGTKVYLIGGGGGGESETIDYLCQGRLTLETGVPISTSDQVDKITLYFTPFNGNIIDLYDGSSTWVRHTFTERSLDISGTILPTEAYTNDPAAGSNIVLNVTSTTGFTVGQKIIVSSSAGSETTYISALVANTSITAAVLALDHTTTTPLITGGIPVDIFLYDNAGTLTLSGTAWTDATTRATALTTQDGIYVKTGATGYRYLGTIYIDAASTCQDTQVKRFVWNYYNQVLRQMSVVNTTSHTYTGALRLWNNSTANNQLEFVYGLYQSFHAIVGSVCKAGAAGSYAATYYFINGVEASLPCRATSFVDQYFEAFASGIIEINAGYKYINAYEASNHASSSFTTLRLRAGIYC